MGRRSKTDLYNLTDRVLELYTRDKLTIREIVDRLRSEGYILSREAVRRSLKTSKTLARELRNMTEEARVMMDAVRDNPNTDIAEAVVTRFAGLLLREVQELDEVTVDDPVEASLVISRLANSQAKLGQVRMKYRSGYQDAKKEVLDALKDELRANHPDILERLVMIVGAMEPRQA
ncbi:MAG: DUF3486 family protein [Treponema sp.]|jgi:hypothetical protein|nr:DUF3486 family protein [Treponema sp.]